ncbi:MAG: WD40-repeat-containing domain protein [Linnemannia elongata]|nr:MAG: WD40-repeat-containing domain protein [Linnemannia elongata]
MTKSSDKPEKEGLNSIIERTKRKFFRKSIRTKHGAIAAGLGIVQLGTGSIVNPHESTGSNVATSTSTSSSLAPSTKDLSTLTPDNSPPHSATSSPVPGEKRQSGVPTAVRSTPVPSQEKSMPSAPAATTSPVSFETSKTPTPDASIPAATPTSNSTTGGFFSKFKGKSTSAPAPEDQNWPKIFPDKVIPPLFTTQIPLRGNRIESTAQLAYINVLLRRHSAPHSDEAGDVDKPLPLDPPQQALLDAILKEEEEMTQIRYLATRVVEEFASDALKTKEIVSEVVLLGPALDLEYHRKVTNVLIGEFQKAPLTDIGLLEGLVEMVECAGAGYLLADDLVKVLVVLRQRLESTHQQSSKYPYHLVLALSRLLDVMVGNKVEGVSREADHEPLQSLLIGMMGSEDIYLKHQAAYAFQALMHIPNDESTTACVLRNATTIVQGIVGVASIVNLNIEGFADGVSQFYDAAVGVIEIADKVYSGAQALSDGGQGLWASLKGGMKSRGRIIWYMALREAKEHIQHGRLDDFNDFVFKVFCRRSVEFQWGICLYLGEIAINPLWDLESRQHAVEFLGTIYREPLFTPKKPDSTLYSWILNVLRQVSELRDENIATLANQGHSSNKDIANHAQLMLKDLAGVGNDDRQKLYTETMEGDPNQFPIKIRLTPPASFPLLAKVHKIPNVEFELNNVRKVRLEITDNRLYIPPQAKPSLQSTDDDALFPLMERALQFLKGPNEVLLLLGDSGAGKSTFNLQLERTLWQSYKKYGSIPLYINLPDIERPDQDLIAKHLKKLNFKDAQIHEMKLHRRFVVICDGYDESQLKTNLHSTNKWNQPGQWTVKVVISCRGQYLTSDYRSRFQPQDDRYSTTRNADANRLMEEAAFAAFNMNQVEQYVEQYTMNPSEANTHQPIWTKDDYMDKLRKIPNLMDLVSNPFLLKLSLDALPEVVKSKSDLTEITITRVELYDSFVKRWLAINLSRLESTTLKPEELEELQNIKDADFVLEGLIFQQRLAKAIFENQDGHPVVNYTYLRVRAARTDTKSWKTEFFGPELNAKLLRDASTLTKTNSNYRFIHKSLLEYFYSRTFYDPSLHNPDPRPCDQEDDEYAKKPLTTEELQEELGKRSIINEPSVMQFLAERVKLDASFKDQLDSIIQVSKTDDKAGVAAANAITILIRAELQFNGADFRGIRIPGADLRGGEFDSANLEGADLTRVNLSKAWMRRANLSKAIMTDVQFGELPFLRAADSEGVHQLAWSFDGSLLVTLTGQGTVGTAVTVYAADNWGKVISYPGRDSIATSPTSHELAVGQENYVVRLTDIKTGQARLDLVGQTSTVTCIAFSPSGKLIAAGSASEEIRIWSTADGKSVHVLSGPSFPVRSLVFSPNNLQLVSCGTAGAPQIWDVQSGERLRNLIGHIGAVESVVYSKDGLQIATAGVDKIVRLWEAGSGALSKCLPGHHNTVVGVAYSPDGKLLASCSSDHTIRLWNPSNGRARNTLFGHILEIRCIAFSPNGMYIASGGLDGTIRLWGAGSGIVDAYPDNVAAKLVCVDVSPKGGKYIVTGNSKGVGQLWMTSTGKQLAKLEKNGHSDEITEVAFSPCGQRIATASLDKTVRFWNALTGIAESIVINQSDAITCLSFSSNGTQLVTSGRDNIVRTWDAYTGKAIHVLEGHKGWVSKVPFSPSDHQVASCSDDGFVRIWDPKTGANLLNLAHDLDKVNQIKDNDIKVDQVIYDPINKSLISVVLGERPFCWDSTTGARIEMDGVDANVTRCSFTPNGKIFAAACRDGVLRLWDRSSETGKWTNVLQTMIGASSWMKWTEAPQRLILTTLDKTGNLCIWELKEENGVYSLQLDWCSGYEELSLVEANLEGIIGLSDANAQLMKQRSIIHSEYE